MAGHHVGARRHLVERAPEAADVRAVVVPGREDLPAGSTPERSLKPSFGRSTLKSPGQIALSWSKGSPGDRRGGAGGPERTREDGQTHQPSSPALQARTNAALVACYATSLSRK